MPKATLIDTTKCIGCRACQVACKQWNQLPAERTEFTGTYENPPRLTATTWTRVMFNETVDHGRVIWNFTKSQCMHCSDAACITVCPSGATHRTEYGTVLVDRNRCIGCNYCAANCPFGVPRYDYGDNVIKKCTFCTDRMNEGQLPACVKACVTGALVVGERRDIMALAHKRLTRLKSEGHSEAQLYGEHELGGLGMVYVLDGPPQMYGLPKDPEVPLSARLWGVAFRPLRLVAVAAAAVGLFANYAASRRLQSEIKGKSEGQ